MNANRVTTVVTVALISILCFAATAASQRPEISIGATNSSLKTLQLTGQTNRYYRIESSSDLIKWTSTESYFLHTNNPHAQSVGTVGAIQEYFRATMIPSDWVCMNNSIPDTCPEHDNVSLVIRTNVAHYSIQASHPDQYAVLTNSCDANWNGCPPPQPGTDYYQGPALADKFQNDSRQYVIANRKEYFWRPLGMTVMKNGAIQHTNVTYIEIGGCITDAGGGCPIYFVLYADGYLRLIPYPPVRLGSVCFGSSVIVGPAAVELRPHADIESLDYHTANNTMTVTYRSGGTATIEVDPDKITRSEATVGVTVNYPTDQSLCSFRSMFVSDGNSDCDTVVSDESNGAIHMLPVMDFTVTSGISWFMTRYIRSIQRESAPNILIYLD